MRRLLLTLSLGVTLTTTAQEQNQTITMEMVPTYSVDVQSDRINIATTFPIDVYVDDRVYAISVPGFHTIEVVTKGSRILVLPHQDF